MTSVAQSGAPALWLVTGQVYACAVAFGGVLHQSHPLCSYDKTKVSALLRGADYVSDLV